MIKKKSLSWMRLRQFKNEICFQICKYTYKTQNLLSKTNSRLRAWKASHQTKPNQTKPFQNKVSIG